MIKKSGRTPTRVNILRILDSAFDGLREFPGSSIATQAANFHDENRAWMENKHLLGYGCPGIGAFSGKMNRELGVTVYVETDDEAESLGSKLNQPLENRRAH